jgi:hypothetical protein
VLGPQPDGAGRALLNFLHDPVAIAILEAFAIDFCSAQDNANPGKWRGSQPFVSSMERI